MLTQIHDHIQIHLNGEATHSAIFLVFLGACVMIASINKYKKVIKQMMSIISSQSETIRKTRFHRQLMFFFIAGYLATIFLFFFDLHNFYKILISLVFFFGAIYVFTGINLQLEMLQTINSQHTDISNKQEQLMQTEDVTIFSLAYQAGIRDHETGQHLERTALYIRLLAEKMAELPKYSTILTTSYIEELAKTTPLHDIGKVGIPDKILRKNGRLTVEEFDIIKTHSEIGANMLKNAQSKLTFRSFLVTAIEIAQSHHERWDGNGYPEKLAGEEIPLSARMMAIADVYDALRCKRYYKNQIGHAETVEILVKGRGSQFDPEILDIFISINEEFDNVANLLEDEEQEYFPI